MSKLYQLTLSLLVEVAIYVDVLLRGKSLNSPRLDKVYSFVRERFKKGGSAYSLFITSYYRLRYKKETVDENTVFLDCFWGRKIGCHPYALYQEILKDDSRCWKFIWVKNKGVPVPDDVLSNKNVEYVEHASIGYVLGLMKAKYLICNSNFMPFFARKEEQIFINTWHGIPLKTLGLDIDQSMSASVNTQRNFNLATINPMASEWTAEKVVGAYGAHYGMNNVEIVGSPRIDLTLNNNPVEVKRLLGHSEATKIVLYAPTWRGAIGSVSDSIDLQLAAIKVIQQNLNEKSLLYVSLHHLTRKSIKELPDNIRYVPDDIDMNIFLAAVDVMVSDYSSIFIDYLVLDKPVILHVPDLESYQAERGLLLDIHSLPVSISFTEAELAARLKEAKPPSHFASYNFYKKLWLPLENGKAAEKCWANANEKKLRLAPVETTKKQILIYAGMLANNGITVSLQNLLNSLDGKKYEIWLMFNARHIRHNSALEEKLKELSGVAHVILSPWQSKMVFSEYFSSAIHKYIPYIYGGYFESKLKNYGEYEALKKLSEQHFDHYIDFTGYSYVQSLIAPFISANKKSIYLHSDMYEEWKNKDRKMSRLRAIFAGYNDFDYLVSVSKPVHEENKAKLASFVADAKKFVYVPNTINGEQIIAKANAPMNEVCPEAVGFFAEHRGSSFFVAVSRLSPEKNIATLVEAFALALASNKKLALVIVGAGSEKKHLKTMVEHKGISHHVLFTGFMPNPYPLVKASDCLVFPSNYEGQGLVLLEALTLGKYCIASKMPATTEILQNGYGELVENNIDAFTTALLRFARGEMAPKPFNHIKYAGESVERFELLIGEQL